MSFVGKKSPNGSQEALADLHAFEAGWTRAMPVYWREKMMQLGVYDTGRLYNSVEGSIDASHRTIVHRFVEYGIYVEAGVGNGYRHGNSGKDDANGLWFMRGDNWRMPERRKKAPWFSKKYYASFMRLCEAEQYYYGDAYVGMVSDVLTNMALGQGIARNL